MVPAVRGGGGGEERPVVLPAQSPGGVVEAGQADPATGHEKVSMVFFWGGICLLFELYMYIYIFLIGCPLYMYKSLGCVQCTRRLNVHLHTCLIYSTNHNL